MAGASHRATGREAPFLNTTFYTGPVVSRLDVADLVDARLIIALARRHRLVTQRGVQPRAPRPQRRAHPGGAR